MEEIALIRFVDAEVRAETLISVRAGGGLVELRLVLPEGEVEVVMTPASKRTVNGPHGEPPSSSPSNGAFNHDQSSPRHPFPDVSQTSADGQLWISPLDDAIMIL